MRSARRFVPLVVAAATLWLPAAGQAKVTQDFTFHSSGTATAPGAVAGTGTPGSYDDIPFTIAPDDADGNVSVVVNWTNQFDDWDLYVYRKAGDGSLVLVGSSAGGPPSTTENAVIQAADTPVQAGNYVIRVQNYAATSADFTGFVKFGPFVVADTPPVAAFEAPSQAVAGKTITLDASGSKDPDGAIVGYAWDLDGNGSMETSSGASATLRHAFGVGVHHLTVRVTDNQGARSYANATVRVVKKSAAHKKKKPKHKHHKRHHKHKKHKPKKKH
jgi:YD repeat-containing protein